MNKSTAIIITGKKLARLTGYTPSRISQLIADGILPTDPSGQLPRDESLKALFTWLRGRLGEGDSLLGAEKLAILQLDRRLKQMQIEREESKLVSVEEVAKGWADIVLLVRQKLLKVANKVSPRLVFAKSEAEIEKEIQGEIEEALRELSRTSAIEGTPTGTSRR